MESGFKPMAATIVIKNSGRRPSESFDGNKLHDSIMTACLSIHTPEGESNRIAKEIVTKTTEWLKKRPEVTSNDIRRVASGHLAVFHPEAAYMYQHHPLML